jgi:hypothetical protein
MLLNFIRIVCYWLRAVIELTLTAKLIKILALLLRHYFSQVIFYLISKMSIFERRTSFISNIILNILSSGKESIVLLCDCLSTFGINNDIVLIVIGIPINNLLYPLSLKS